LPLNSEISEEKIAAFQATHYRVGPGPGNSSSALVVTRSIYTDSISPPVKVAAFSSPPSIHSESHKAMRRTKPHTRSLGEHLRNNAPLVIEGSGADPAGLWSAEKSYFALGMNEEAARILGKLWRQDAVVWAAEDAVPRLILLR
jgi:hypothetical protein